MPVLLMRYTELYKQTKRVERSPAKMHCTEQIDTHRHFGVAQTDKAKNGDNALSMEHEFAMK